MSKKYLGVVCLLYSGIIAYVWFFGKLKNFLAPTMQIYIKLSLFPLIVIGLIMIFNSHNHYKFKISDLVLMLPLIFLALSGDGRLTTSFAFNRTINISNINRTKTESTTEEYIIPLPESPVETTNDNTINQNQYDFSNPYFDIIDENYNELSNYLTFYSKADKYNGKTIKVSGFALKNANYVPTGYFAIGKDAVSCWTADANFAGFIIKYDINKISDNKWYSIEGILEKGKDSEGYDIMYINAINVNEINKGEQYVYPCYSYEENACEAVLKYNLEY